jgi:uncharacterized protein
VTDELAAGDFSSWLTSMQEALGGEHDSDVPCNGCTACCRSSQFVHIARTETDTLARIPKQLLFPAPQQPDELVMGYDERGHCPMLVDDRCSIYEHRPQACRTYDCRVLAATGLVLGDRDKQAIAERVALWRFSYPTDADVLAHEEVRARADALADRVPSVIARAVLAVRPAPTA